MDHCLAQIFGVGQSLCLTERDVVGRPAILKNRLVEFAISTTVY
jgi:hypothetical protein